MSFLPLFMAQSVQAQVKQNSLTVITTIKRLSEIERPATNVNGLFSQSSTPQATPIREVVQVTQVKANPTAKGVEVILQTTKGEQLQVTNRSAGNSFIADIPNAQLRLPNGDGFTFRSEKPLAGITEISVTNFDDNTIRVTVIGEASSPTVELFDSDEGLIFGLTTAASTAQQPPTQQTPQVEQPANQTPPEQPSAQGEEPIELVVTGEQDGYRVPNASVGTRTDTPLRDIPQSIQVIPQEVLRDQNVNSLNEALRNVPGVISNTSSDATQNVGFTIRGFDTTARSGSSFLRDGLRDGGDILSEIPNIERIEVLKGPASVLYGAANPGGTINQVTKQPLRDPFYAIDATIGNYDFYKGGIDLSGPLNDSKTVLYRLNTSYLDRKSFVDFFERKEFAIAPVVSWAIGKRTRLILEGEYTEASSPLYQGLPAAGTILPNPNGRIPRNRFAGEPDGVIDSTLTRVGYRLEHQFSDNWSLQNAFRVRVQRGENGNESYPLVSGLDPNNRTLNRNALINSADYDDYDLNVNLTGRFSTGSISHQLALGVDLSRSFLGYSRFAAPSPIDLFNPVYRRPVAGPFTFLFDGAGRTDTLGIYIQDQVTLAENLKLLLGGRFDLSEQTSRFLTDTTNQSNDAFSPRVGIVYQPIKPISLYASYSRSFTPNSGTAFDGSVFQPERGTQYEVGVKADLNERISATLAFYDLTRSNIATDDPDPDPAHLGFSILTGEQRSRGVEFSIGGEILPGWNIIAGYAYTDAQITEDNTPNVGNLLANVPKNAFNLWTSYEIQRGSLQGFGVGVGLFFVGERQADLENSFQIPSYLRTDAAIFYKRDRLRAALNFRNLFNVDYFESAFSDLTVLPGEPFTVQGTISWQL
ncbi:TonB-dependent siderophore receptor [Nostoc sp. ChiQUE01b]|uniref:TonB-dependent siderophore receptor n=1 Tax=Nostoc sp. ChiQUE01b TaxID=3075376 RepID=UPI002AD20B35|nr:TonB-dependent siderophore receptor [Nostoc sp. ChiQUE01b]